jgi:hypothetical protein
MNSKQKVALWIGVGLIVGTCLYPPWVSVSSAPGRFKTPSGYHWLFSSQPDEPLELDTPRLLIQWVAIAALTAGFLWATPSLQLGLVFSPMATWWKRHWKTTVAIVLLVLALLGVYVNPKSPAFLYHAKVALDRFFGFGWWGVAAFVILFVGLWWNDWP